MFHSSEVVSPNHHSHNAAPASARSPGEPTPVGGCFNLVSTAENAWLEPRFDTSTAGPDRTPTGPRQSRQPDSPTARHARQCPTPFLTKARQVPCSCPVKQCQAVKNLDSPTARQPDSARQCPTVPDIARQCRTSLDGAFSGNDRVFNSLECTPMPSSFAQARAESKGRD
jgi:hypothetical protein